ncbi:creatininase family protein, partial [Listeria monocytogenes]
MVQSANKIINMTRDEAEKAITDFPVAILPL